MSAHGTLTNLSGLFPGRPPEDGEEDFHSDNRGWLHVDQSPKRSGLHAFQGAVYLEHADEDDWTFEVRQLATFVSMTLVKAYDTYSVLLNKSGSVELSELKITR